MAVYLEKRIYTRSEITPLLGIKNPNRNFSRQVKAKLKNLGFKDSDYIYDGPDSILVLWQPSTIEDKILYLVNLLGIDCRVNTHNFAMFLYGLFVTEDLQCMPYEERSSWLKDNWDVEVSAQTLRKWVSNLLALGAIIKDKKGGKWWGSGKLCGETIRWEVQTPEAQAELKSYWQDWHSWKETHTYKETFTLAWRKYGCCYYKCPEFLQCAWQEPIIQELLWIMAQYANDYWEQELN